MKAEQALIKDPSTPKHVVEGLKAGFSLNFIDRELEQKVRDAIPGANEDWSAKWLQRIKKKFGEARE